MAVNDITIVDTGGYETVPTRLFIREDLTTSSDTAVFVGEPLKIRAAEGGNDVIHLATGDPEIGTDIFMGISAAAGTETSTVDGTVELYLPLPGVVYRCAATTPANIDTAAKLLALLLDTVTFDLTGTTFTVDENEGSDENVHGLRIVDGDIVAGTLDFEVKINATRYGDLVA